LIVSINDNLGPEEEGLVIPAVLDLIESKKAKWLKRLCVSYAPII
jgi:hypothetical protein